MQPPRIGDIINERYQIDSVLARGGMGIVYRATHLAMNRPVALKMVLGEQAEIVEHVQRFKREVDIAMRLRHPNIVEIYDFGQTSDSQNFVVMELLEGHDLKTEIAQNGPLPLGRIQNLLGQLLDALCTAHHSGVIHRDLKPSNIMLTRIGRGREFPKILDFGIAKAVGEHTELTVSGEVLGSIPYLAPESLQGAAPNFQVDVYAMGLITLEMLTGKRARQGENTAQILTLHLTRDIEIPKEIEGTALAEFLTVACSRDPNTRFTNAIVMADALEHAFLGLNPELRCAPLAATFDTSSGHFNLGRRDLPPDLPAPTVLTPSHSFERPDLSNLFADAPTTISQTSKSLNFFTETPEITSNPAPIPNRPSRKALFGGILTTLLLTAIIIGAGLSRTPESPIPVHSSTETLSVHSEKPAHLDVKVLSTPPEKPEYVTPDNSVEIVPHVTETHATDDSHEQTAPHEPLENPTINPSKAPQVKRAKTSQPAQPAQDAEPDPFKVGKF